MPTKISSLTHPLVKHFVKLRSDSRYRHEQKRCLVMGKKAIEEATQSVDPIAVLTDATEAVFKKITALQHPEPCVAEFPLPPQTNVSDVSSLLVIDRISDPGNLGTLLRTALALRWGGVFFLPDCVDPFNDKVLRSSKAALFSLPYQMGTLSQLEEMASGFTSFVADLEGAPLPSIEPPERPLLVLSNEAKGVSSELSSFGTKVTIPIGEMESLNVAIAGGIMMYTLWKTT